MAATNLLQGTLDLLILKALRPAELHGLGISQDDGKTLYITAVTSVYRIKLAVAGAKTQYQ